MSLFKFFRRKMRIEYEIAVPPFDRLIDEFTSKMAKDYFDWYMEMIPSRIQYLSEVHLRHTKNNGNKLDYSPESLIDLWDWFIDIAEIEKTPSKNIKKLRKDLKGLPDSFVEHVVRENEDRFTLLTEYIIRDIGMYMGEVLVKTSDQLSWSYFTKPKNLMHVNTPLLKGFIDDSFDPPFPLTFEPIHMVGVQASKIFDKEASKMDLFNLFQLWNKYIQT